MDLNYTEKKLYQAVLSLTGEGTIRFRLIGAAKDLLELKADDFPDDGLRGRFSELGRKLTKVKPEREEGSIQASVFAMSEDEASALAEEIVSIYADLAHRDPLNLYHSAPTKEPEFH